ncbi:tyrosyl-tRNA synthetase [Dehalogenimonas lykanthroporepellens BL-DC-9]|nr:tyrosyl-tRNA synthetase [Dehalogenimonas lykanthroporepellens BL-DC-9]
MNVADLDFVLRRAVSEIISEKELRSLLSSGKKLRLKEGFDPSSPDIHLGHMVGLRKLRQFQEMGHQVVLIVGDWTAQIGDPTGASVTRPILTAEQVRANAETYLQQFFKVVDRARTEVRWQSEWFTGFTLADVIKLTSRFTIAQMLARDDFKKRFDSNRPITITEFLYPLLQAYDSVMVEADIEFGGNDQKFNLLVGRELQSMIGQPPQQVFMTPILTGTGGGRKMSKSLHNHIGVAEPPEVIFGKVMSIGDDLIMQYFELLTDITDNELDTIAEDLKAGQVNPMEYKKRLAREILLQLYPKSSADKAMAYFESVHQRHEVPDTIPEIRIDYSAFTRDGGDIDLTSILCQSGLTASRGEAKRLIAQGGVSIDGNKVTTDTLSLSSGCVVKAGKRKFARLIDYENRSAD